MGKILLYFLIFFITVFSIDSININRIFKPNKVLQARIFYFLLTISKRVNIPSTSLYVCLLEL